MPSNDELQQAIQVAAYYKWERAGKPNGNEATFWQEAVEELPQPLDDKDRERCLKLAQLYEDSLEEEAFLQGIQVHNSCPVCKQRVEPEFFIVSAPAREVTCVVKVIGFPCDSRW